jgi:hypothetical protein
MVIPLIIEKIKKQNTKKFNFIFYSFADILKIYSFFRNNMHNWYTKLDSYWAFLAFFIATTFTKFDL